MFGKDTDVKENDKKEIDIEAIYPGREQKEYFNFFSEQTALDPTYEIRLYKIPDKATHKGLELLEVYTGVTPHENEFGPKYGGGNYKASGRRQGQEKADVRYISLAQEVWDRRKEEHDRKTLPVTGDTDISTSLNILERLAKIQASLNGGNGNGSDKNITGAYREIREMQISLLKEDFKTRSNLYKELKQLQLKGPEQEKLTDQSEETDTLWDHPLVQEAFENLMDHGLSWLKSTGPKKELGRRAIQSDPNFQELANNEKLLLALYNRCKADDKIGEVTIDKIYKELGMDVQNVPDEKEGKAEENK